MIKGWKGMRTTASYLACFPINAKLAWVGPRPVAEAEVFDADLDVPIRIALLDWSFVSGSMVLRGRNVCSWDGEMVGR
jgi:hypothetical protein